MNTLEIDVPDDEPVVRFRRFAAAPPALVFAAWTTPEYLLRWWGPPDLPLVSCALDLRVGGDYHFVHRAGDGTEHVLRGTYLAIEPPRRLRHTTVYGDDRADAIIDDLTFTAAPGGTVIECVSTFPSRQLREFYVERDLRRGLTESHQRLDALLAELASSS